MIKLQLSDEEAEVLDSYVFKKLIRLKESGLEDSKCYPLLLMIHAKLQQEFKGRR